MGDASTLIWGLFFGSIGVAYMMYGKRRQRLGAFIPGLLLCIYPYFVDGAWLTALIGGLLVLVPFVYRD